VEELLAERGVLLTYETVRQWCGKFGQAYANELRRRCKRRKARCCWRTLAERRGLVAVVE